MSTLPRKWLLAIPAVIVAISILWVVAFSAGDRESQSRVPGVDTPPANSTLSGQGVVPRATEPPSPQAVAGAPVRVDEPEPDLVAPPDGVDLSDRASVAVAEPEILPPLPDGALLPDLVTLPSTSLFIGYNDEGTKFLHFENSILNQGMTPLEVRGTLNLETNVTDVSQRIYIADGAYIDRPIGSFHYHPSHEHWHIADLAEYRLFAADSEGLIGEPVVVARKASYCLRDDAHYPFDPHPDSWPDTPVFEACETVVQGISPGWMDTYAADTPGQDLDITGLPDGIYALVSRSNPEGVLYESNLENNVAVTLIELAGDHVILVGSISNLPTPFPSS